jgi:hypothetical protein
LSKDEVLRAYKIAKGTAKEARERLQAVVNQVDSTLKNHPVNNPSTNPAWTVLSASEIAAFTQNPQLGRRLYGNAVERLSNQAILADPQLDARFAHVGGANRPDFIGRGEYRGLNFDITTVADVQNHLNRPGYGRGLQVAAYETVTVPPWA